MNLQLEKQLKQEFLRVSCICKDEYQLSPTRFLQILENRGPVNTAIVLVKDSTYHKAFVKLWEFGRLDLTVEAIILRDPYNQLFSQELLNMAKCKLIDLGYTDI